MGILVSPSGLYKHISWKVMPVSPALSHLAIQQVFIEYLLCAWHCYNHYEYIMMKTKITANRAFVWTSSLVMKQMRLENYLAAPLLSEHGAEPTGGSWSLWESTEFISQ